MLELLNRQFLFVGGKGGVGKTTTAAALALMAVEQKLQCLLVSTDPAHSLGDLFGREIGDRETSLLPGLHAVEIDPDLTTIIGRSSGAHLGLLAAYHLGANHIRGVVGYYPPTDMVWSWNHPMNPRVLDTPKVLGDFLGGTLQEQEQRYRQASPTEHVSADCPPTLLIHGLTDELVCAEQSRRLEESLRTASVPHFALLLPWATHGCEANLPGPSGQLSTYAIERFLTYALSTSR